MKKLYLVMATVWLQVLRASGQPINSAYALLLKGLYSGRVEQLKATQLHQQLQSKENKPLLLDTRTPAEYQVSHIAGARLMDYDALQAADYMTIDKETPIVLYCTVGYRSERVGEKLLEAGFNNVYNLYGGLFEWVNKGFIVSNQAGITDQVHTYSKTWSVWLQKGEKVYA